MGPKLASWKNSRTSIFRSRLRSSEKKLTVAIWYASPEAGVFVNSMEEDPFSSTENVARRIFPSTETDFKLFPAAAQVSGAVRLAGRKAGMPESVMNRWRNEYSKKAGQVLI